MTHQDLRFFQRCFDLGLIKAPFLEVGAAKVQGGNPNLCETAQALGIRNTYGVDLDRGPGVDAAFDFSLTSETFERQWIKEKFATVAVFNVLEHTFDPFVVLRNASSCLDDGGVLIVVVPVVWPLHNYPGDYLRLMPQWYIEFAKRNQLTIHNDAFCWLSGFGISDIDDPRLKSEAVIPSWQNTGRANSPLRYWGSRIIHKIFNTYGRSHWASHVAIGAAFRRTTSAPCSHEV